MRVDGGRSTDGHVRFGGRGRRLGALAAAVGLLAVVVTAVRDRPTDDLAEGVSTVEIEPSTTTTTTPVSDDPDRLGFRILAGADVADLRLHIVQLPFNRGPRDAIVHRYVDGGLMSVPAVEPLFSNGRLEALRSQPGDIRDYLLSTPAGLVITSAGIASLHDPVNGTSEPFAEGIAALPGSDPETFWLFTSAERSVHLVEVGGDEGPVVSAPFDLESVGRPLGSTGDGLVVRLDGAGTPGDLAVWRPDASLVTLPETAEVAYLGAGGETVVLARDGMLEIIDAADPEPGVRRVATEPLDRVHRAVVSPDGRRLAVSILTDLTEANRIDVIDLDDGRRLSRISPAIELFFRWADTGTLVYMEPDLPAFELVAREVTSGEDRRLARFDDLTWWFATDGRQAAR